MVGLAPLLLLVKGEGRVVLRYWTGEKDGARNGVRLGSVMEDGPETVIEGEAMEILRKMFEFTSGLRQCLQASSL